MVLLSVVSEVGVVFQDFLDDVEGVDGLLAVGFLFYGEGFEEMFEGGVVAAEDEVDLA